MVVNGDEDGEIVNTSVFAALLSVEAASVNVPGRVSVYYHYRLVVFSVMLMIAEKELLYFDCYPMDDRMVYYRFNWQLAPVVPLLLLDGSDSVPGSAAANCRNITIEMRRFIEQ